MDSGKSQHNRRSDARSTAINRSGKNVARNQRAAARRASESVGRMKPSRINQIGNVGPASRPASSASAKSARALQASRSARPLSHRAPDAKGTARPTASDDTLLSRRRFLYGALGVGALAAAAVGAGVAITAQGDQDDGAISALSVPTSSVTTLDALTLVEDATTLMRETANVELPLGSLVWASSDTVAACLIPTETGSPLAQASLISLESAAVTTVLEQAAGQIEGFEIYDVRASEQGIVWTEANILDGVWRVYTATLTGNRIGSPVLADSGDPTTQTPSIAAVGPFAFWQVNPQATDKSNTIESTVRRTRLGAADVETVASSPRRLATPLYALADAVVFSQRVTGTTSYQLTKMNAESGEVEDTLVLPRGMTPLHAAYGKSGFMFAFESIYNYGEGISNLGTYAPHSTTVPADYGAVPWFCFGRTPTAAPAWCGRYLMVKSSYSVCGIDLDAGTYFALDVDDGADDYGEYLASTGQGNTIVTFTSIDYQPVGSDTVKTCRVKVWRPVA